MNRFPTVSGQPRVSTTGDSPLPPRRALCFLGLCRAVGRFACWPAVLVFASAYAHAAKDDWVEGSGDDGASRDYYNAPAKLPWRNFLGDWADAVNRPQGEQPFGKVDAAAVMAGDVLEIDVTPLVQEWLSGRQPNQGMLLRLLSGGRKFVIASRESEVAANRPALLLEGDKSIRLPAVADIYLESSTYRSVGGVAPQLRLGSQNPVLIRFDLDEAATGKGFKKAVLRLVVEKVYGSGECQVGVFRCSQGHAEPPSEPLLGLARKFPGDRGLGDDPQVLLQADFETPFWDKKWSQVAVKEKLSIVGDDQDLMFQPLRGKALKVKMAQGENTALNTLFKFGKKTGEEPEEIFFRYYLRLADDWNQTVSGGKMPGVSGTYGVAGWGGRKSNGENGWSARGAFSKTVPADNPLGGLHPIGTYCYHADMEGFYGDVWLWQRDYRGYLESNRWYCVEQQVKLNTPGEKDGELRTWIDGRLAFEKTDIRFRHVDRLKVEQVWLNVYHGGKDPSPRDQHLYLDHVVIARQYIGPLAE
ncbi:polysaccharide lyase [Lignipirellula cremea]|uniref:Disaggregatase related repeat protein n=1 Tax=Lignipirellula cremea TaxID=2528010 RepID=A0A518DYL6_9BACT|nr:hypothetical protein [Lignipirellula cremea]QDU96942.1 Disaggregatase related repeat protein [Lignipirellula cremea]